MYHNRADSSRQSRPSFASTMMRPEYLLSTLIVITRVLEMHPTKTKIAYCKDKKRGGK
jgi:hypothetical protein